VEGSQFSTYPHSAFQLNGSKVAGSRAFDGFLTRLNTGRKSAVDIRIVAGESTFQRGPWFTLAHDTDSAAGTVRGTIQTANNPKGGALRLYPRGAVYSL